MQADHETSRRVRATDGVELAVYESGRAGAPVVVLVHGYPDDHRVWDGVTASLLDVYRVVRYDVRGSGASDQPRRRSGYRIEQLSSDLLTVIDAVSPDQPVHLVAHDWGSIQVWDALTAEAARGRIQTFTSISGPSLDHSGVWFRGARRAPLTRLRQLLASYYIAVFLVPLLPALLVRLGVIQGVVRASASLSRSKGGPAPSYRPGGRRELVNGIELYRANVLRRVLRPRPPLIDIPVQVVTPSHDIHVMSSLATQAPRPFVTDLTVSRVRGNHWVIAQKPQEIAQLVRALISAPAR